MELIHAAAPTRRNYNEYTDDSEFSADEEVSLLQERRSSYIAARSGVNVDQSPKNRMNDGNRVVDLVLVVNELQDEDPYIKTTRDVVLKGFEKVGLLVEVDQLGDSSTASTTEVWLKK